jgi:hypothetical protein
MQRITIDVNDKVIDKILYLLQSLKDVKIVKAPAETDLQENEKWSYWKEEELDNFGKIAIGLSHHDYDEEDYSKW